MKADTFMISIYVHGDGLVILFMLATTYFILGKIKTEEILDYILLSIFDRLERPLDTTRN